jgi:hypothetical protein
MDMASGMVLLLLLSSALGLCCECLAVESKYIIDKSR